MSRVPGKNNRRTSRRGPGRVRPEATRNTAKTRTDQRSSSQRSSKQSEAPASRLTGRAIVLLSVVLLLLASYTSSLHAWWSQHKEIESTKTSIAKKKADIASLKQEKERLKDDAYIQQRARERFGWVKPGEVGYRVIGVDGKIAGDAPELDDPTGDKPDEWYGKLWGSVTRADNEPSDKTMIDPDKVLKDK